LSASGRRLHRHTAVMWHKCEATNRRDRPPSVLLMPLSARSGRPDLSNSGRFRRGSKAVDSSEKARAKVGSRPGGLASCRERPHTAELAWFVAVSGGDRHGKVDQGEAGGSPCGDSTRRVDHSRCQCAGAG
jgi:hypothetical protein